MFQTLCSNCEDDYEERRFIVEREYKISDSDVPSKWVSVETDLPVDSRVVWAYDKRRGIVIIAWRRWISPEKGSNIGLSIWESCLFGDDILIKAWYDADYPGYPPKEMMR